MAIVPQALPILIERLSFYLSFLNEHGFSVRHQTSCSLTAEQAQRLLALTGDELFAPGTAVAVLLLEREEAYASFSALRAELDIVYGSGDRDAAMLDILSFFSTDSASNGQPQRRDSLPAATEEQPPLPEQSEHEDIAPQPPSSRPPLPPAEPQTLAILVSPLLPQRADVLTEDSSAAQQPEQQQPEQPEPTPAAVPPAAVLSPATSAESEGRSPAASTAFHWEEIEAEPAQAALPSSPSPLPSSPSLTPVSFHPAPMSPSLSSAASSPVQLPSYHQPDSLQPPPIRQTELPSPLPPQAPPNTATLSSAAELKRAKTTPATLPQRQQPAAPVLPAEAEALSPLHMVEIKRASLTAEQIIPAVDAAAVAAAAPSPAVKGPQDLLALPSRRTIKERLAALNLKEEPAAAQQPQQPALVAVARVETAGEGAAAMREKQQNISEMFARRLSREKTKHAALLARFPSIAALGPDASIPSRPAGCDEYRSGLPSRERLLASDGVSASGVLYHMTGEEAAWEQCFTLLHHDCLYLCAAGDETAEVAVMLQLSEPGISLAYAEGVVEVKGERDLGSRHLLAADIPDIDRWYELMCSAKIQFASEERTTGLDAGRDGQHGEEDGYDEAEDGPRSHRRPSCSTRAAAAERAGEGSGCGLPGPAAVAPAGLSGGDAQHPADEGGQGSGGRLRRQAGGAGQRGGEAAAAAGSHPQRAHGAGCPAHADLALVLLLPAARLARCRPVVVVSLTSAV